MLGIQSANMWHEICNWTLAQASPVSMQGALLGSNDNIRLGTSINSV